MKMIASNSCQKVPASMRWWLARGREDGGGAPLRGVRVESYRSSLPRRLSRCDKMASVDGFTAGAINSACAVVCHVNMALSDG